MISIRNVYWLLAYAFPQLRFGTFRKLAAEPFENAIDLLSEIILLALEREIKRGLRRDYKAETTQQPALRGRIELLQTAEAHSRRKSSVSCTFDEYTADTEVNRILASTVDLLLVSPNVSSVRKPRLRRIRKYFVGVSRIDMRRVRWRDLAHIRFDRNSQLYRMLLTFCQLIADGLLQTPDSMKATSSPPTTMIDFVSDQRLCDLFEKFLFEFFRQEFPELSVSNDELYWFDKMAQSPTWVRGAHYVPEMKTDVVLSCGNRVLIIDAKFYKRSMQYHHNTSKLRSEHLYQVFSYVHNARHNKRFEGKSISGMLIYAKPEDEPTLDILFPAADAQLAVKSVDLSGEFQQVKDVLHGVVQEYFS